MPTRWFVPIPGLDPTRVRLDHVHAAVSGWFDRTLAEHRHNDKPYAVSPPTRDQRGVPGLEVVTLSDTAAVRLAEATATASHTDLDGARPQIRLGNQWRALGRPRALHSEAWTQLAQPVEITEWRLDLATPTTFRSGNRASPLPSPEGLIRGARAAWAAWSDTPLPTGDGSSLWVSDLDVRSQMLPLTIRGADGAARDIRISGITGTIVVRHEPDDRAAAALVRATAYAGVGAMTLKGLGVARVAALRGRRADTG